MHWAASFSDVISADFQGSIMIELDAAYLAGTDETHSAEVDLYDSGTTRHMSGFYHRLVNYVDIDPIPIKTADKCSFHAIGKGDMYIYLPNRDQSNSKILLKDVLYVPRMGITLVSISREFHGFRNPWGLRVGYAGVRVRVAIVLGHWCVFFLFSFYIYSLLTTTWFVGRCFARQYESYIF